MQEHVSWPQHTWSMSPAESRLHPVTENNNALDAALSTLIQEEVARQVALQTQSTTDIQTESEPADRRDTTPTTAAQTEQKPGKYHLRTVDQETVFRAVRLILVEAGYDHRSVNFHMYSDGTMGIYVYYSSMTFAKVKTTNRLSRLSLITGEKASSGHWTYDNSRTDISQTGVTQYREDILKAAQYQAPPQG